MDVNDLLTKYKSLSMKVVILLISIFVSFKIYSKQDAELKSLYVQKELESEKNATLNKISELYNHITVYKEFINVKEISSVLDVISNIAKESGVEIGSIRPEIEKKKDLYVQYPYNLTLIANTYHNLGNFISRLENHPDIFLVENVSMSLQPFQDGEKQINKIAASLTISTIIVN